MKVLLVGGGGREHALAWKIAQSPRLTKLYVAPGNPGTAELGENVPIEATDTSALVAFAKEKKIDLTLVGPEDPLADGIVDRFKSAGLRIFGPTASAARLEADKAFAKQLMRQYSVPTAEARVFTDARAALIYLDSREEPPVIKAAGLAKGKGVIVCGTMDEARGAVRDIMQKKVFGDAGDTLIIEERLTGQELSILAFVDGHHINIMETCQDHKPIGDGDTGPNTGGMGAYSPVPIVTAKMHRRIESEILVPIVDAMIRTSNPYRGCLYAGLMLTPAGPKVIEFNCRFGDPETQPLMMRLKTDLLDVLDAAVENKLDTVQMDWDDRAAVCVVMASGGYPGEYEKGIPITGLDDVKDEADVQVFHAGTKEVDGQMLTNGGRVLSVTGLGKDIADAQEKAYGAVSKIYWQGVRFRKDIGDKALK